jgi:hypothetical protein
MKGVQLTRIASTINTFIHGFKRDFCNKIQTLALKKKPCAEKRRGCLNNLDAGLWILDPGLDFSSLDCTAWIFYHNGHPQLDKLQLVPSGGDSGPRGYLQTILLLVVSGGGVVPPPCTPNLSPSPCTPGPMQPT